MKGEARFWSKVDRKAAGECWPWTGNIVGGYGHFALGHDATAISHRFAYESKRGPIPEGMQVDHTCHNGSGCEEGPKCPHRRCCNPAHLEAVSARVNILRGEGLAAKNARKDRCLRGHEFTKRNTYLYRGSRTCRACKNLDTKRRRALDLEGFREKGRRSMRKNWAKNRDKINARQNARRAANVEAVRAYDRAMYAKKKTRQTTQKEA